MQSFFRTCVFIPRDANQGVMIELIGELGNDQTDALRVELEKYIEEEGIKFIILNANHLKFISSQPIGYIIEKVQQCESKGVKMCIADLDGQVKEVMELVGLTQIASIFPNNPVAIAAMKNV
jgi:anti-anti-sigma factor